MGFFDWLKGKPSTVRLEGSINIPVEMIAEINSPALKDIIEVLNHESVNLYAEHLLKELGKVYKDNGSTSAGIDIITGVSGTVKDAIDRYKKGGLKPTQNPSVDKKFGMK